MEALAPPVPRRTARLWSRKLALGLCAGAIVYGALLLYADVGALAAALRAVPLSVLALGALLSLGNFVLRLARWHGYLRVLAIGVTPRESVLVFFSGFAMTITPGKLGEVLKPLMLHEARGVAISRSVPVVVAERLTDLLGLLVLAGLGAALLPGGGWVAALCLTSAGLLTLLALSPRLALSAIALVTRVPRLTPLRPRLVAAHLALKALLAPRVLVFACALALPAWALQALALLVVAHGFSLLDLTAGHALAIYAAPLLAGALSLLPGGLGLTEASMTGAVQQLAGASPAVAAGVTIVVRLVTFWLAVGLGFGALSCWNLQRERT